jgi:hypothetical protein
VALGAWRRGNEVGDCCGDERRSSRCLFIGLRQKRKWCRHEWPAVVSATFKSFGYSLGRGEDGAAASILEGEEVPWRCLIPLRGRWSDGMARRPEAVATIDFGRGRPEEGDEVGWAVLGWLGLKAN